MNGSSHRTAPAVLLLVLAAAACTGSADGPPFVKRSARSPGGALAVVPAIVALEPGGTVQFAVSGASGEVAWSVDSAPWAGTISASGLYEAPAVTPPSATIRCASVADPSLAATATVTFPTAEVAVTPGDVPVAVGGQQAFTATVAGAVDQTVVWYASEGTIDADGTFHAPTATFAGVTAVRITARASARYLSGDAWARLYLAPPSLSPLAGPGASGQVLTLSGTGFFGSAAVLFPDGAGGTIRSGGRVVSPTQLEVAVPAGAGSGALRVEIAMGGLDPALSNTVAFARAPHVRLRADRKDVEAGGSTALRLAWMGPAPAAPEVVWSADRGTVSGGTYHAPDPVLATTFAHVTACLAGTASCDTIVLGVHPLTVLPDPALVPTGGALALRAQVGGATVPADWSVVAGGGAVSADGVYRPTGALADAGLTWLVATAGTTAAVQVGVTGLTPGVLGRVVDHADFRSAGWSSWSAIGGAYVEALTVSGTAAYVVGGNAAVLYGSRTRFWIDVYDLSDPDRPVWTGAIESATRPDRLWTSSGRLYAFSPSDWNAGYQATLAIYDLSGPLPALVERLEWGEAWGRFAIDGERFVLFEPSVGTSTVTMNVFGTSEHPLSLVRTAELKLPPDANPGRVEAMTAVGDRAYVSYFTAAVDPVDRVAAYDLSLDPPALVTVADGGGYSLAAAGPLLFADHAVATIVYDRRGDALDLVAVFPFGSAVVGWDLSRVVLNSYQSGIFVADVRDPSAPRLVTSIFDGIPATASGALVGDRLLLADGLGGVAILDVGHAGGPVPGRLLELPRTESPYASPATFDVLRRHPYTYVVGSRYYGGGWLGTYDSTAGSPALVSVRWLPGTGHGLARSGDLLAVGTSGAVELFDLSTPAEPAWRGALTLPTNCIASVGDRVYVGVHEWPELAVVDASAPEAPVERARLDLGGQPYAIRPLSATLLAVAVGWGERKGWIALVDVSDPSAPFVKTTVPLAGAAYALALDGPILFAGTFSGLSVVDLTDPSAPFVRAEVPLPGKYPWGGEYHDAATASALAVHDGILWVGTYLQNGMIFGFDVRNLDFPRMISVSAHAAMTGAYVASLAFDGAQMYVVGQGIIGPAVVDISRPRNVITHVEADPALQP